MKYKSILIICFLLIFYSISFAGNGKIIQYHILYAKNIQALTVMVNNQIKNGWEPYGNLTYSTDYQECWFQTIVKRQNFTEPIEPCEKKTQRVYNPGGSY